MVKTLPMWLSAAILLTACTESGPYLPPVGSIPVAPPPAYLTLDLPRDKALATKVTTPATGATVTFRRIEAGSTPYAPTDEVTAIGISTQPKGSPTVQAHYVALTELTQAQWQALVAASGTSVAPKPWTAVTWAVAEGADLPACNLSHAQIQAVLDGWNSRSTNRLRLPTSIEWENACRAGTTTAWSWGDTEAEVATHALVQVNGTTSGAGVVVGGRSANPWGLYDLHGNVWEWVSNGGTDGGPCLRGGSWSDPLLSARSGNRLHLTPTVEYPLAGLRLVLEMD